MYQSQSTVGPAWPTRPPKHTIRRHLWLELLCPSLMPPKARFSGDGAPIQRIIAKAAVIPNFLDYGEDLEKSQVQRTRVIKHAAMWRELAKEAPALIFSQKQMVKIFAGVAAENEQKWGKRMTKETLSSWTSSLARQFRCMAAHISRAKQHKRAWYNQLGDSELKTRTLPEHRIKYIYISDIYINIYVFIYIYIDIYI